jgi:hypothetical protein
MQLIGCLPHVIEAQNVWMVDQFHEHNFTFNAEQDLIRLLSHSTH